MNDGNAMSNAALEFKLRDCWPLKERRITSKVKRKYTSGFDAVMADYIVYFTARPEAMNPAAVLVPEWLLEKTCEGAQIELAGQSLLLGRHKLDFAGKISSLKPAKEMDHENINENILRLQANIKLFGRDSLAKELIPGCSTPKMFLAQAEELLIENEPDLQKLSRFIGVGEGLTPSFDDLLCGMLIADRLSGLKQINFPQSFFADIPHKTTAQATQQIHFADLGYLNLECEKFVIDFVSQKVKASQILKVMRMGHSSGTDILCGVWLYFAKKVKLKK